MSYKILGISGSPVKNGNVEMFLQRMMEGIPPDKFSSELINLSRLEIKDCVHCNFCLSKQKQGKYCSINDDAQEIFEKVETSDIIVLASPVYFMRTSGLMAAFIDRLRVFAFGNLVKGKLRNKVGVSAAISWARNAGLETTHLSHLYAFMILEMIPVSVHKGTSPLGASVVTSKNGSCIFEPSVRLGFENDELGLKSAKRIMERATELIQVLKRDAKP